MRVKHPHADGLHITIAITTFRRASQLRALLATVDESLTEVRTGVRLDVVVVDNDPDASARAIVNAHTMAASGSALAYLHETHAGIAAARQRALDAARGADAIVFLDDDVVPLAGWLPAIIHAWEEFDADAVMGFVKYEWPPQASPWIVAGGFMRRDAHATGTELATLATGNALIDMRTVQRLGLYFDDSLGLSGGEDSLFGEQLVAKGGKIVACLESVVLDEVPGERTTRSFVRRRTISHGQGRVRMRLQGRRGALERARIRVVALLGGVARLAVFFTLHLGGKLTRNVSRDAVGMRRTWFALGMVQQALGKTTSEYARP